MRFVYSWKSSDGLRHEGEMEASDRESVFAALRERGIRAIKVTPIAGRHPHPAWVVVATLVVVAAIETAAILVLHNSRPADDLIPKCDGGSSTAFTNLVHGIERINRRHNQAIMDVDFDLMSNLSAIEKATDSRMFRGEIGKARAELAHYRGETKRLFESTMGAIPVSRADERIGAQVLYGRMMERADEVEDRVDSAEAVLNLLEESRGKWHMVGHDIVFNDPFLRRAVEMYSSSGIPATARWRRDFGQARQP